MNQRFRQSLCAAGVLLLFSGCAVLKSSSPAAVPAKEIALEKRAGAILLTAFIRNDAELFLKQLPQDVAREFGENGFKKTRESMIDQLGTPVSFSYAMDLQHPSFVISVWKIRYERKSSDRKKTLRQETLFRTVSHVKDGRETLLAFNFF